HHPGRIRTRASDAVRLRTGRGPLRGTHPAPTPHPAPRRPRPVTEPRPPGPRTAARLGHRHTVTGGGRPWGRPGTVPPKRPGTAGADGRPALRPVSGPPAPRCRGRGQAP